MIARAKQVSTLATLIGLVFIQGIICDVNGTPSLDSYRELQNANYYFLTSDANVLGAANPNAAMGNPLKGMFTSPRWTNDNTPDAVPDSLEFFYIGLDEIMRGNNLFNWTVLDTSIATAVSRNKHVAWRVVCHYPGEPLRVPKFLTDQKIPLVPTAADGISPQYDNPILTEAFRQLIFAMGARYDGNKAIAFLQLGLLGKWGEWHTFPENNLISAVTRNKVIEWYKAAFTTTQLQVRGPLDTGVAAGMGLHDDSFAYSTLGTIDYFFWPTVNRGAHTSFWKKGMMAGETRPELQGNIFEPSYPVNADAYKQDFQTCVNVTHATAIFHHHLFENLVSGAELVNARNAHVRMGYNFQVTQVGAALVRTSGLVNLDVTVTQIGVAPFYYPLSLVVTCPGGTSKTATGVESLVDVGSSRVFSVQGFPSTSACLGSISISLSSAFVQAGRPIKFAQGTDGRVSVKVPVASPSTPTIPASSPALVPTSPDSPNVPTSANGPPTPNDAPRQGFFRRLFNCLFGWLL